jgi:hypothetical protein
VSALPNGQGDLAALEKSDTSNRRNVDARLQIADDAIFLSKTTSCYLAKADLALPTSEDRYQVHPGRRELG